MQGQIEVMGILMKDPHDFICPLTGQLFEDPVTLETGQTFEREAIGEWFDQGNRTCSVTGKTLACSTVPLANSILKYVIDSQYKFRFESCNMILDEEISLLFFVFFNTRPL